MKAKDFLQGISVSSVLLLPVIAASEKVVLVPKAKTNHGFSESLVTAQVFLSKFDPWQKEQKHLETNQILKFVMFTVWYASDDLIFLYSSKRLERFICMSF